MTRIDHFFVLAQKDAPEHRRLLARGLRVGLRRSHPGQGTENLCFGFGDSYLELLWLTDHEAARANPAARLGLHERARWRDTGASPFGICVAAAASGTEPPFAHWHYRPPYLPVGVNIHISQNCDAIREPLLFQIDRPFTPFDTPHELAATSLTKLRITTPELAPRSPLHAVAIDGLELCSDGDHLMEVVLDGEVAGGAGTLDLRPELPLVLRW